VASEKISPHPMMQAWEKISGTACCESGTADWSDYTRMGPGFPAQPDHRAPFRQHGFLFGHEHANSPFNDGVR
jgi:hypothetical protein